MGYQMMLIWPLIALGWIINDFQRADVSWARRSTHRATRCASSRGA
jgi:hypothetical protein